MVLTSPVKVSFLGGLDIIETYFPVYIYLLAFREEFIFQLCGLKQCSLNTNNRSSLDLIWLSAPHSLRLTLCLFIENCRDANDAKIFFFF